jgi:hypothetical protein
MRRFAFVFGLLLENNQSTKKEKSLPPLRGASSTYIRAWKTNCGHRRLTLPLQNAEPDVLSRVRRPPRTDF